MSDEKQFVTDDELRRIIEGPDSQNPGRVAAFWDGDTLNIYRDSVSYVTREEWAKAARIVIIESNGKPTVAKDKGQLSLFSSDNPSDKNAKNPWPSANDDGWYDGWYAAKGKTDPCPFCGSRMHSTAERCHRVTSIEYYPTGQISRINFD